MSFDSFQRKRQTTDRAPGCSERPSGAAEPGSVQRWQCHLVHTTIRYHCLESLNCVLCNQLACSIVILQLITWAVNSGQLCLKKKKIPPPPNHSPENLSAATLSHQYPNNRTLRTKSRKTQNLLPIALKGQCMGGERGDTAQWQARFTAVPLSLTSFPSPPVGLQPEKGASDKE